MTAELAAETTAEMAALALRGVTVRFGPTVANREVTLEVAPGTIHAVVGENGAGKSTLMRAAVGLVPLAVGEVWMGGERLVRPSPEAALRRGVGMVHQHFMLIDTLTVVENVVLGAEPRWLPSPLPAVIDRRRAEAELAELASRHQLAVDPHRLVGDLSVGEQQRVEILKVLYKFGLAAAGRVLILDEPTAVLAPAEVEELLRLLRALAASGVAVVLVTHKLDEVMAVSSRVTVLRRGEVVARLVTADASAAEIARAMVGREVRASPPPRPTPTSPPRDLLTVAGLTTRRGATSGAPLCAVSFAVRAGEIVGVAGVEGNGQTALAAALTGLCPSTGAVRLDGIDLHRASPAARRRAGVALVAEDRHRLGLVLELPVAENLALGREHRYRRWGLLDRRRMVADAHALTQRYDVRPDDVELPARALSGGNQQKLLLARALAEEPRLLVAAQPTRGVDVGAIERIHELIAAFARPEDGRGVLLISAELDELLALSDRVLVLCRGRLVATLDRADATRERIGALMTGADSSRQL